MDKTLPVSDGQAVSAAAGSVLLSNPTTSPMSTAISDDLGPSTLVESTPVTCSDPDTGGGLSEAELTNNTIVIQTDDNTDLGTVKNEADTVDPGMLEDQNLVTVTSIIDPSQQQVDATADSNGKQFLIVTADGSTTIGMGTLQPVVENDDSGEPAVKRFKIEGEDGQSYIFSVGGDGTAQSNNVLEAVDQSSEHQYQTKQTDIMHESTAKGIEKRNQLLGSDVSQAWFTTRDDKNILQNNGASWKQGQWTKDEIDLLQINISDYCRENNIGDPTEIIFEMSKDERKEFYRTIAKGLQRPLFSVYRRVTRMYDQKNHMGKYSHDEMIRLRELRHKHGNDWATIGQALGRSASSVKDKCRLMKETCNSGKWLPEEEKRLSEAVYDLVGCKPGEDVVHGLSWAHVAEKVLTRSEKQCRTKWLNYMNWKQKGGKDWTREDDINLILRVADMGVVDDTQIDWDSLSASWDSTSVRSPQWLRGKWWSLKRHIPDYQLITFNELLQNMKTFYLHNVRVRNNLASTARTRKMEGDSIPTFIPISLNGGITGDNGSFEDLDPAVQAYEVLHQLPNSSASYIITQPLENPASLCDHVVQTVPVSQTGSGDLGDESRVVIRVMSSSDLSDTGVTSLETSDLGTSIHIPGAIDQGQQGLDGLTEENVISHSDALSDDPTFHTHTLEESVISSPEGVEISIKQEPYVPSSNSSDQLMTSFSDPMLNSDSNGLMEATSDMEADKIAQMI